MHRSLVGSLRHWQVPFTQVALTSGYPVQLLIDSVHLMASGQLLPLLESIPAHGHSIYVIIVIMSVECNEQLLSVN